jgi:uncharacterized protein YndB with AHSA1/START domain
MLGCVRARSPIVADRTGSPTVAQAGVTITRVFDAPRRLVWREWTEPGRFADWFGGPGTRVPLSTVFIDLRPGGAWRATTLSYGPDGRDICWEGEYLEIIEPELLAFTIRGLYAEQAPELVTVMLTDLGDGRTQMHFRHRGTRTAAQWRRAREAWSSEFDRIAKRVLGHTAVPPVSTRLEPQ